MIKIQFKFLLLVGIATVLSSCDGDEAILPTISAGPTVNLLSGADLVNSNTTINAGTTFTVSVSANQGDSPLNSLRIQEDGVNVPTDRLTIDGSDAAANPVLLFNSDKMNFTSTIIIAASEQAISSDYTFQVTDEDQQSDSETITITTESTPPALAISGSDTLTSAANQLVSISVAAMPTGANLQSIAVYENDSLISQFDRLSFDMTTFDTNPFTLPDDDKAGFDKSVVIRTMMNFGPSTIRIEVTDELGQTASDSTVILVGSNVDTLMGVLFNAGGRAGTGGFDLDTGEGTGSSDMNAEIKDEGIDTDLPAESNWKKQISGVNGSVVKYLVPGMGGLAESFAFENISFKENIAVLFDNGLDFTEMNAGGDLISGVISAGDILIVQNGEKSYLINVSAVNETSDDNGDSYTLDIKF